MIYFRPLVKFPKLLRGKEGLFLVIVFITLIESILSGVGDPIFLKFLIDSLTQRNLKFFIMFSISIILLASFIRLFAFLASLFTQRLKNNICEALSLEMLVCYYKIPYKDIITKDKGYFMSRIYDEPLKINEIIDVIINLIRYLVTFLGSIIVCLFLSWKITIIISFIVPSLLYLSNKFGSKISKITEQENEAEARLREYIGRAIDSYKSVNIFNLHSNIKAKINKFLKIYLKLLYSRVKSSSAFQSASSAFLSYAEVSILITTGIEVIRKKMTIGGLFGFMSGYWRLINSFRELMEVVPSLAKLSGHMNRIEEIRNLTKNKTLFTIASYIELDDISFAYNNNLILNKFNLSIKKGEKVLITGPNGSGKTTLVHIITGFLEASGKKVKLPHLSKLSVLLLDSGFIPGNLKDNVDFENLTLEKKAFFLEASKALDIYNKIEIDPLFLSEGERKKFQIIMTLLKDADFYIFDEPLANVDVNSKDKIMDIIFSSIKDRGLIVVMHGDDKFKDKFDREVKLCSRSSLDFFA